MIRKVGQPVWWSTHDVHVDGVDTSITVTKLVRERYADTFGPVDSLVVMFKVTTGSDPEMAKGAGYAVDSISTTADDGEQKSPGSYATIGDPPDTLGTNHVYTIGAAYPIDQVETHGWLTLNANGGSGNGVDYRYDLRKKS